MPITSTNTFSLSTIQHVDIDCSAVANSSQELAPLIGWVQTVPQRSNIHVTLRFATANATGRRLKSIFQSLGCRVIMKTVF
jgi:hypothetical protein